ncbi:Holliday junction resolvase RecU [Niallia sp. MER 6]|uniref:Holliday junction resolvase RecU n=1 Tax=Niallia sp. MER 6 TaxID=2939567 RepID=UPI00203BE813|nr:Holliday junction resolvase RecU [Niallia sp. MER 6]MCM3031398.1 Holliday junction resolvase RecU [Niallia sp. MER 6]
MEIKYPNGKSYIGKQNIVKQNNLAKKNDSYSNRGMRLEELINESNDFYLTQDICVVHKKPTPITVVSVDYSRRSSTRINEAYYQTPSTLDYCGIYKSRYLDFDAKETKNKTSFPLSNFHQHQIEHMERVKKHGGICFAIFYFKTLNKVFHLDAEVIIEYWKNQSKGGRKSIPFKIFEDKGNEIKVGYRPSIDYIKIIDKLYF